MEQGINFSVDKCVQCESANDLNTFVNFIIDGKKIAVGVCDSHLDISISKVRGIIVDKRNKLLKLIEEMKSLGLDVSIIAGNNVSVAEKKGVKQVEVESEVEVEPEVKVNKIAKKVNKKMANTRSISGEGADRFSTYDVDSMVGKEAKAAGCAVPVVEEIELQVVAGKGGVPVQIPKRVKDSIGSTEIHIVPTSNKMIDHGKFDERSFAGSYDAAAHARGFKECNLCSGTGESHSKGHSVCPKCKGTGIT